MDVTTEYPTGSGPTRPAGEVYDWYHRGVALLEAGDAAAAAALLGHVADVDPASRCAGEALARAQFDAGSYLSARETFARLVAADPADDYAHFGLGLAARRAGDLDAAAEHLALAVALRPESSRYRSELRGVRAARARPR